MKIVYLINARIPTEKAHGLQIMKACEAFSSAGVDVDLFVSDRATSIKKSEFEYYNIQKSFNVVKVNSLDVYFLEIVLGKLCYWIQTFSFLYNLNKITFSKDVYIYTRNLEIAWLFSTKGFKVVYEAHTWPQSKERFIKYLLKSVTFIICNSRGTQNKFINAGYKNTLAVANGVDLNKFISPKPTKLTLQTLKISEENKIIMYTGHLYKWKGVDVIIETAKLCRNKLDYLFVLIGGTEKDQQKYINIIKENNLINVRLIEHCEPDLIPSYLTLADVLLLPNIPISEESTNYTSPLKLFEYMATNKPIVASKLPSISEILDNSNAILVEPNNPDALLKGIKLVIDNPDLAKEISTKARSDVAKYSWTKRAENIIRFLNNG